MRLKGFRKTYNISSLRIFVGFIGISALIYTVSYINDRMKKEVVFYDDENIELDELDLQELLAKELPSVPLQFMQEIRTKTMRENNSCAEFPNEFNLDYHNNYWQTYYNGKVILHLYGAYYDMRPSLENGPVVRLLGLAPLLTMENTKNYCQVWFTEVNNPTIVPVVEFNILFAWGRTKTYFFPYLITCRLPESTWTLTPRAVSIVKEPCENATNSLKVNFESSQIRQPFAICVKGLNFPKEDISATLIEWLELMRLLGAHKIYISIQNIQSKIAQVINYYEKQGFVESRPTNLGYFSPALPILQDFWLKKDRSNKQLHEAIVYNDCFYRNIYKYDFIAAVDIDEVMMPLEPFRSWQDLFESDLSQISEPPCSEIVAYCFNNIYFPVNTKIEVNNSPLRILIHMLRSERVSYPKTGKCFHNTDLVLAVHNHFPLYFVRPDVCSYEFNASVALLQHYRNVRKNQINGYLVEDRNILRFKKDLMKEISKVFDDIGIRTDYEDN